MAVKDYIPSKDTELKAYTQVFSTRINEEPVPLGLTAAIALAYQMKQNDFVAALDAATDPLTRGKRTVYLKQQAKKILVAETRKIAQQVTNTISVTDDQRQSLGLPIKSGHRTPKPVPDAAPALFVTATDGRSVTLELRQDRTRRGRPENVATATVFKAMTATGGMAPPPGDPAWQFVQTTGSTTVNIDCGTSTTGDTVHLTGFWSNAKGESGPAARAINVNLPADRVAAAESVQMRLKAA